MISDIIAITSGGENMGTALDLSRKVAPYSDLSAKGALHLRLLAEEMMGMMRSITGETKGKFWIEVDEDVYQLHLIVDSALKGEPLLAFHPCDNTRTVAMSSADFFGRFLPVLGVEPAWVEMEGERD